jgi:uncharacterized protein (TIGR00251 family)
VQPRSRKSEIAGIHDDLLKVKITSPPVDGQANESLIKFFSKLLSIPKSEISIIKGERAKRKKIKISGIDLDEITGIIKLYVGTIAK